CMAQLNAIQKRIVEGKKHRDLQHHWKAATHGIDLVLAVELHHGTIEGLTVVLVDYLQLFEPGLQLLHGLHRLVARLRQGPEGNFDEDSGEDDRHPIIMYPAVEQTQELQHGAS